jgi:Zn-dependent alcohol dehydrogenase
MPASALAVLPEKLPFAESAIMGCAIFTAYGALRNGADLRAGETVAVIGVGGVGGG